MAGRPKTMVKKVAPLEETAFQLYLDLYEMRPAQYAAREGVEGEDRLAWWWNEAARTVRTASMAVSILLGQLEARAGYDSEALERQRDQRRGLWPAEAADEGAEEAEKAGS